MDDGEETSSFLMHVPCESCGSSNANALYTDGHTHCFACSNYVHGDASTTPKLRKRMAAGLLQGGEVKALPARRITQETCAKFGYTVAEDDQGNKVQVAPYFDKDGTCVAQKIRGRDKEFSVRGSLKNALPFGAQAFPKTGKMVVVTEGEIDAMSVSQVNGNKYPVVSISVGADTPFDANGKKIPATKIKKYFATHADYFAGFETVVIMFDNDQQGRFSAQAAAEVLGNRAKIAELELKDPNEMLVANRSADITNAMWRAKVYRPEGIVQMSEIREAVMVAPTMGKTTGWKKLDKLIYGVHGGEIILLTAGTGVGKTDVTMQITEHMVSAHHDSVGLFMLEGSPAQTVKQLIGKNSKKRFHIPAEEAGWTQQELEEAFDRVVASGKVFLYDSFGANDWLPIKSKIEYLYHTEGVRYFVLDHLTALVAGEEDARIALDTMMEDMASLVVKLGITIVLVSHLNRPIGKAHEEGGRVTLGHLRNSGSIAMWSHLVIALERDQQADDEATRFTTTVRILKFRRDGTKVGQTFDIRYDPQTGCLNEADLYTAASGFGDETQSESTPSTHATSEF